MLNNAGWALVLTETDKQAITIRGSRCYVGVFRRVGIIQGRGPSTDFDIVNEFPEKVMAGAEG